jgi:hypothetical protein
LAFLVLNSEKKFPLMVGGGGKNRVLVYSLFGSFLEDLNIYEFSKILGHCPSGNDKRFLLLII